MANGLVLEGGAMRGMFTAGVMDILLENGIKFDGAVGVSAGAAFGVNFKSKQTGRVLRYNLKYAGNARYASWKSWRSSGNLYGANFCYHILPTELDPFDSQTFKNNPMEFWTVSTNIKTGKPAYHLLNDADYVDLEWIRASSSIPFFANPVAIGGEFYVDGGVSDSIPIRFAENHYDKNVLILTQPKTYQKGINYLWPIEKMLLHKYPAILNKIKTRSKDYNRCLDYIRQKEGKELFVIRPPYPLEIGMVETDKNKIKNVYNIGRQTAEKYLFSLKKFLLV